MFVFKLWVAVYVFSTSYIQFCYCTIYRLLIVGPICYAIIMSICFQFTLFID